MAPMPRRLRTRHSLRPIRLQDSRPGRQFRLNQVLLGANGRVVSTDVIAELVRNRRSGSDESIAEALHRLRAALVAPPGVGIMIPSTAAVYGSAHPCTGRLPRSTALWRHAAAFASQRRRCLPARVRCPRLAHRPAIGPPSGPRDVRSTWIPPKSRHDACSRSRVRTRSALLPSVCPGIQSTRTVCRPTVSSIPSPRHR